jgi:hypothetical protein
MNFDSTNTFETSQYFTARDVEGRIIAQIVRTDAPSIPSNFWGYRMLKPGVGGKSQAAHLRRFGPFSSFDEAQKAIEDDFQQGENDATTPRTGSN